MEYKEIVIQDIKRFMKPFNWVGLSLNGDGYDILEIYFNADGALVCTCCDGVEEAEETRNLDEFSPETLKAIYEELRYKFNGTEKQECRIKWDENDPRYGVDLPEIVTVDLRMTGSVEEQMERLEQALRLLYDCKIKEWSMRIV